VLKRCQARNAIDIVSALISSSRTSSDCESYLKWKVKSKPPLCLILQKWIDFPSKYELRCWVFEGVITAINPLAYPNYFPVFENENVRESIINAALRLQKAVNEHLPWQNYILDIIYDDSTDSAIICEFNPWGPHSSTGSQLYSWQLDYDILFGLHMQREIQSGKQCKPDFRYIRKPMKVKEMFNLSFGKEYYKPSEIFKATLDLIDHECPCCPRSGQEELPPTKLVHLTKRIKGEDENQIREIEKSLNINEYPLKMIFAVRDDLDFSAGKIAILCCDVTIIQFKSSTINFPDWTKNWMNEGQAKIVLRAETEKVIDNLEVKAKELGISYHIITEDDKKLVFGLGPAPKFIIDQISGKLKLFK